MRKRRPERPCRFPNAWLFPAFLDAAASYLAKAGSALFLVVALTAFFLSANPGSAWSQCNPAGNPTRYEFNINPTSMLNLVGQQFCTSPSVGSNCCGAQPSYRCLDLVFNLANGPAGQTFGTGCHGIVNLMTSNGNFDALYFGVGLPNPTGNAANCTAPVALGNNDIISMEFSGTATGQVAVHLVVVNHMGVTVFTSDQTANPGQAVILTVCKPGFGCLDDEIVFGCCSAGALLALAPAAPAAICSGSSATLNVTGQNGTPPYTVMLKAASASGTAYFPVTVNSDGDANTGMDIASWTVTPAESTVYSAVSVEDAAGCVQPVSGPSVTVSVFTQPIVNAGKDVMICKNKTLDLSQLGASLQANGSGVNTAAWTSSGTGAFQPNSTFAGAITYAPSANDLAAGLVTLTLTSADPPGVCAAVSDQAAVYFYQGDAVVCNDTVMIALDEDGEVEILPDMILEGDVIDSMFLVQIFQNGVNIGAKVNCSHLGKFLKVRISDKCSGAFCTSTVWVADNLAPKPTCTDVQLICAIKNHTPDYLKNVLGLANAYPAVDENCGQFTLSYIDTWTDLSCDDDYIRSVRRTWTAVDGSGNKSSCVQYINYLNQSLGQVLFPPDVTLSCSNGPVNTSPQATGTPYLVAFGLQFPLFPDAGYCKLAATFSDNKLLSCDGSYDLIRTWVVYDWCLPTSQAPPSANPKYVIQIIKVIDDTGPELACPGDLTVSTDPLGCCSTTNLPDILAEDRCSRIQSAFARVEVRHPITGDVLATYDLNGAITSFPGNQLSDPDTMVVFGLTPCLPLGAHTVTYTVQDACGNTSSCTYRLTVDDQTPPVVACDEITQVALGIDGMIFVNATTFDDGSYDNCSPGVYFKARRAEPNGCQQHNQFYDQVKFCCDDINDTVEVILRVYDVPAPAGPVDLAFEETNANDCLVQVYIEDKIKPSCQAPATAAVSCENFDPSLWAYGAASGVDNCCVDTILVNVNYNLFDTVCNRGTITRTFQVLDCGGLSNQCTQRIYVNYEQDYSIRFPHDFILTICDGAANYGEPQFFGEDCELLGVSYEDEVFTVVPDACFKIERTWTIINWCTFNPNLPCTYVPNPNPNALLNHPSNLVGPTVSPAGTPAPWAPTVVKVNPGDPQPTDYSSFWSAYANCYKYKQIIKITDKQTPAIECPDTTVQVCDLTTNHPELWHEPQWFDLLSGSHDLCEAPTDLCIATSDACSGADVKVRYLLYLDLDRNGSMETVISSTNPPAAGTVAFDNAANPNFSGGTLRLFDNRTVDPGLKYRFALQTVVSGNKLTACVRWNTPAQPGNFSLPELPYGTHKIKWIVEDGCGNERVCEYTFVVKDCKAPTITCYNGLSTNLMPQGMITVNTGLFVENAYDNCTPADLLIFGIREAGTGGGFPFNPDGSPQTAVTFACDDVGFALVEIWAMDLAGNSDFCATYINVQDKIGACGTGNASVAGVLQTENGLGVEDANVQMKAVPALSGQSPFNLISTTNADGQFQFTHAVPPAASVTVMPVKDNDPLNGVSTFDLVLINKHILGLQPLGSPYKMIAADANNSRSVTTSDIVELRKLILGIYTELPENTSWRFLDKSYVFPNQYNPFQEVFPEVKEIAGLGSDQLEEYFIAVKTGDVNGNAVPNTAAFTDDRSSGVLFYDVQDRRVEAGELFTVEFKAAESMEACQFTLAFPGLEVADVLPGPGMSVDNFGIFPREHALTASFNSSGEAAGQAALFAVTFRAATAGQLSQILGISSRITRAEAYRSTNTPETLDVRLRFDSEGVLTVSGVGFELYQNQPNPWATRTRIGFHLPEAAEAALTVFNETGRVLYAQKGSFSKGYNSIAIDNGLLDVGGLLYYKLETPTDQAVRKMARIK